MDIEENINKYRCIHLADQKGNDKLCKALERLKELEEKECKYIRQNDDWIVYQCSNCNVIKYETYTESEKNDQCEIKITRTYSYYKDDVEEWAKNQSTENNLKILEKYENLRKVCDWLYNL